MFLLLGGVMVSKTLKDYSPSSQNELEIKKFLINYENNWNLKNVDAVIGPILGHWLLDID